MRHQHARIIAAAFLCVMLTTASAATVPLYQNLVVNGDAETGDTSGWVTTGSFQAAAYGSPGLPTSNDPGGSVGGKYLFYGGDVAYSTADQKIDVSQYASDIDTTPLFYDLSAMIGGTAGQHDLLTMSGTFLDQNGKELGSVYSYNYFPLDGPPTVTGLFPLGGGGSFAPGTRTIDIHIQMARMDGVQNDAFIDNISFEFTPADPDGDPGHYVPPVPEPEAWAMMIAGLGMVGASIRHRRSAVRRA